MTSSGGDDVSDDVSISRPEISKIVIVGGVGASRKSNKIAL